MKTTTLPTSSLKRTLIPLAAALLLGVNLAGCARNPIRAQWTDPSFAKGSLKGARVLVQCDAGVLALRQICEQEVSQQLTAAGVTPVTRSDVKAGGPPGAQADPVILSAAREAGAAAVLHASIRPDATVVSPRPTVGIGIGSWGGWSSSVGGSVGVSVPVGNASVATAYAAEMALTDVASGKLIWTSTATAPASSNPDKQVADLAKAGISAAKSAGVL
jgi:hypothetical protein